MVGPNRVFQDTGIYPLLLATRGEEQPITMRKFK